MLLNIRTETGRSTKHAVLFGTVIGLLTLIQTCYLVGHSTTSATSGDLAQRVAKLGHTEVIGRALYSDYLLPFEITSILLLAAIIGAVILSKKKI